MAEKIYRYRNLEVVEGKFGRLAKVSDDANLPDDGTVLIDAIKLAAEKGDHTLFHASKSVYVKPFRYKPAALAKALDLDES
jgi:hypothetical protein